MTFIALTLVVPPGPDVIIKSPSLGLSEMVAVARIELKTKTHIHVLLRVDHVVTLMIH